LESQIDHSNPLQPLIINVDESAQPVPGLEKKVTIDVNRRQAVLSTWFRAATNFKYFLVALGTSGRVAHGQTQVIYLSDLENGRALSLKVNYSASCVSNQEDRVAEALFDGPSPSAVFHALIKSWMHDYISQSPAAFINDYFRQRESLVAHIANRALTDVGLTLNAELSLCGGPPQPQISIGPTSFTVAFLDHNGPYTLRLSAELSLDGPNNINAFVYDPSREKQDELMQSAISHYLASIPAQEFLSQLKTGELETKLRSDLNEKLRPFGRLVEGFSLDPEIGLPEEFSDAVDEIQQQVFDNTQPLLITSIAKMTCQNYARYLDSGSPEIRSWLLQSTKSLVSSMLFSRRYIEILFEFDVISAELIDRLKSMATMIGYELHQSLSLPGSEISQLLERFTIRTETLFESNIEGLHVKLQTVVTVRPKQLDRIREHLKSKDSLQQLIEPRIIAEIAKILRQVHPADFYNRFRFPEGNDPALAAVLTANITTLLDKEFDCEVSTIHFEPIDTEFSSWLTKLRGASLNFEAKINSLTASEPDPISFQGLCKIEALDPTAWKRLHTLKIDLTAVKEQMIENLESNLETRAAVSLTYLDEAEASKVKIEIGQLISDYMLTQFGLLVSVNNLRRKLTLLEEEKRRKHADLQRKKRDADMSTQLSRIEEIRKLEQYLIKAIASNGAESEITQLRRSIEVLRSETQEAAALVQRQNEEVEPVKASPDVVEEYLNK
jgi:hypothetical protein